jgi:hypothetical protein
LKSNFACNFYDATAQALGVKNNTNQTFARISATCGFYRGDELLGAGLATFDNVAPGQTAYDDTTHVKGKADRSDCRIKSAR